ncbi:YDG domain-containing protein [Flavobacterium sp. RHBU_24]|uniref:YDG domain-containing protein n=2 Tax=Flavobacterium sp. RHBU_24 TaxID=3391185 RepID=UPI0039849060
MKKRLHLFLAFFRDIVAGVITPRQFRERQALKTTLFGMVFTALFLLSTGAFAQFTDGHLAAIVTPNDVSNTTATIIGVNPALVSQTTPSLSIAIPGTGANAMRLSGSAGTTGYLSNSDDGSQLLFTGVNTTNTSSNVNSLNPRAVGVLKHAGSTSFAIGTVYTGSTSGNPQTRCATTVDNVNYYIADQIGLYTNGSSTVASTASYTGNLRSVKSFGGTVYGFGASLLGTFSSPTATALNALPGVTISSASDFYLISSGNNNIYDILYVLLANGNINKYSLVSGSWIANGSYAFGSTTFALCAAKSGSSVYLYFTTGAGTNSANTIRRVTDTAGYNATINVTAADNKLLYTTASGTTIKGIAFAPLATPPAITGALTATATIGQPFTYQITANAAVTSYNATGLSGTGLSIDTTTGVISGTPTTTDGSPLSLTISATNSEGTGSATLVLTINRGTQTITFNALDAVNDNTPDFNLAGTASSGLAVTYTSSNTAVATVTNGVVHITGAGSTDITASQAGNTDYLAAADVVQTLVVNSTALATQTITFPQVADATYGDTPFTLSATASSGLDVTYTSSNTAVATVSGSTVTIVGAGEVTIYADQAGDSAYNAAPQASSTFTVAPKLIQVVGAVVQTRPYDGTINCTIDISGTSLTGIVDGDEVSVASVTGTYIYGPDAGVNKYVEAYYVLAGADSANYTAAHALYGTVTKADQVITFSAIPNKTTLDTDFAPGATSASSAVNAITYTSSDTAVATIVSGSIHIVGEGVTTITASQAESQNYNAATATQTLTVVAPNFTAGNIVVVRVGTGSAALTNAATPVYLSEYTTNGTATFTLPVPSATAGSRVLMSGSAGSEGQLNLSGDGQYLTIAGYDAAAGTTSVVNTTSSAVNRVVARVSANAQFAVTPLGTAAYSANNIRSAVTQDGTRYWAAGANGGIYTVDSQGLTTTLVSSTVANNRTVSIFNSQLYFSTGSGANRGIYKVGTGLPTGTSTTATLFVNTGGSSSPYAYSLIDRGGNNRNMYIVDSGTGLSKYSSNDGGATWTAQGTVATASTANSGLAARLVDNAVEVYVSSETGIYKLIDSNAFDSTLTASFTTIATAPANTRFRGIAFAPQLLAPVITNTTLTIAADINVAFEDYAITANNAPAGYAAAGLPEGVTINTQTGVISGTPQHAGTYNVTISATNDAGTDTETLVITVAKGYQVITFDSLPPVDVNDPDFELTATSETSAINPITYTSSNTAVATISGATVQINGVGSTTITAYQAETSDYYAATAVAQTQVVTSASLSDQAITFNTLTNATYGDTPFELTATASSGLPVTYTSSDPSIAAVSGNMVTIFNVGTVNITASQSGDSAYNAAPDVVQPLIIAPKTLTVSGAAVTTKPYDNNTTATVTGGTLNGIVGSDDVILVSGVSNFASVNTGTEIPVTTGFTLTGAQANRYTVAQPALTGTIIKANQAITLAAFAVKTDLEAAATLTSFSTTSALNPVSYTSSNPAVATVTGGNILTIVGTGTATITASQAESQNYNATSTSQVLTVQPGLYLNQFTGASACPTNGNIAVVHANTTGTEVIRSTVECQSTGNVFNSKTLNNTANVNPASYIEFSVTATPGNTLNVNSLYFFRQASNSAPNQLEIRYSTDGFATSTQWTAPTSPTAGTYLTWDFPDFTTAGTVTFRLYPYGTQRADLTGASSASGTFRVDDVTVFGTITPCYEWTGAQGTNWNTAGNWCGNAVPTATADVTIPNVTNKPVITSGVAHAKSITITDAAATLTVNSGATLSVENNIASNTTTGNIIVQNNGAIVQGAAATANNNTGKIEFHKFTNPLYRLDYTLWSAPITGQTLRTFSMGTSNNRFYIYDYAFNGTAYVQGYWPVDPITTYFTEATGYLIRMPNTITSDVTGVDENGNPSATTPAEYVAGDGNYIFDGTFTGKPNNGSYYPATVDGGDGFTAVGNPYPSPISLEGFLTANNGNLVTDTGLWFWRKKNASETSYLTLNLSGLVTPPSNTNGNGTLDAELSGYYQGDSDNWLIAPAQGFIVQAQPSATTISFTNSMRRATPGAQAFFRTAATTASRYWLNMVAQNGTGTQALVAYSENGTMGIDYGYDSKVFNTAELALYSLAADNKLAIQARPGFEVSDVVPMGFTAPAAGQYTISIDHMDGLFAQGQTIYLKDLQEGVLRNLSEYDYTFTSEAGNFEGRFEVHYQASALGTTPILDANSVVVFKQGEAISINTGTALMGGVKVFDVRGRQLYTREGINATETVTGNLNVQQQVLIVEITTDKGVVSKRIVF